MRPSAKYTLLPVLVAVSLLAATAITVLAVEGYTTYTDTIVDGASVEYRVRLWGGQQAEVRVISPVPARIAVSAYMWMPDGRIRDLGVYTGVSRVELSINALRSALEEWRSHLVARNNDPRLVKPGLILFVNLHSQRGVETIIKSIPLSLERLLERRESVVITLSASEAIHVASRAELEKLLATAGPGIEATQWPPDIIENGYLVWKLVEPYSSRQGVGIPLVAVLVHGHSSAVNDVSLREYYAASRTRGVEVVFSIAAAVQTSSGVSYTVPGYTMSLASTSSAKAWLDYRVRFWEGIDFTSDAIVAIGFIGDAAFARYRLYYCFHQPKPYCLDTGREADMTLGRPAIENNMIKPWYTVDDNPYDGIGYVEEAFKIMKSMWEWSRTYNGSGGVYIDVYDVMSETQTTPLLAASAPVLTLLRVNPTTTALAAILSFSVGISKHELKLINLACDISLETPSYSVYANYFYTPASFEHKGSYYRIGSLLIDALVSNGYTKPWTR